MVRATAYCIQSLSVARSLLSGARAAYNQEMPPGRVLGFGAVLVFFVSWLFAADPPPASQKKIDYARDVQPILEKYCYDCHGPKQQLSGLRLDQKDAVLRRGGYSGQVVIPGDGEGSRIIRMVGGIDGMPMPMGEPKPTQEEIKRLRDWVDQGAVWPDKP
jgi:mono/diheme cytochrome c family protein